MRRLGRLLVLLVLAQLAQPATHPLAMGDSLRGREVFLRDRCVSCHSINGQGGDVGPDLTQPVVRGFSPHQLATVLWNHAPGMWAAWQAKKVERPELREQDAADLFVYLYTSRFFEAAGDSGRGKALFQRKGCASCHGMAAPLRPGIEPVSAWRGLDNPVALAQQMWNHSVEMKAELEKRRIPYPRLSPQELVDLLGYLRSQVQGAAKAPVFSAGSAAAGRRILAQRGCLNCHQGTRSLEARPTRHTLADFTSALWNHAFMSPGGTVPLSYEEMNGVLSYLVSTQFFEERGDAERGRRIYSSKHCASCHDQPSSGAPQRTEMTGRMNSFVMIASIWRHGPAMLDKMRSQKITWPHFDPPEMADVIAFLHGQRFRQRR